MLALRRCAVARAYLRLLQTRVNFLLKIFHIKKGFFNQIKPRGLTASMRALLLHCLCHLGWRLVPNLNFEHRKLLVDKLEGRTDEFKK